MLVCGIGAGRVGLPFYLYLSERGHEVRVYDKDPKVVQAINAKRSHLVEPGVQQALEVQDVQAFDLLEEALESTEMCFVYVPTLELFGGGFDTTIVQDVCDEVARWAAERPEPVTAPYLVVVCSTIMPGTMGRIWAECPAQDAVEFFYCPPLVALGQALNDHRCATVQYLGVRDDARRLGWVLRFYTDLWGRHVFRMSWLQAELAKLFHNVKIAKRIHFGHMVAGACDVAGVDPVSILRAMQMDRRLGSKFLLPGPPPDGTCIDRDVRALRAWAREQDADISELFSTEDWHREELLLVEEMAHEAGGPVLVVGTSYKPIYFGDLEVPCFSNDLFRFLMSVGFQVAMIPAPKSVYYEPEFDTSKFKLICLMEPNPVAAKWARRLADAHGQTIYDPWRQLM